MGYLIPNDHNDDAWICIRLDWPNSPMWLGILRGIITLFRRGRTWDGGSGSIASAQSIGEQIFDRNWPFRLCADAADTASGQTGDLAALLAGQGSAIEIIEDDAMGQVVTEVRVENGVLYVEYGKCCIETFQLTQGGELDQVVLPGPAEQPDVNLCGAANALVEAWKAVMSACFDAIHEAAFWNWAGYVEARVGMDLNNNKVLNAVSLAYASGLVGFATGDWLAWIEDGGADEDELQRVLCQFYQTFLNAEANNLPWFGDVMRNELRGIVNSVPGEARSGYLNNTWRAMDSIDNLRRIAAGGLNDETAECDCPSVTVDYWTNVLTVEATHFSPNDTISYDDALEGDLITGDMKAFVYEGACETTGNGSATYNEQNTTRDICPEGYTGSDIKFGYFFDAEGEAWLDLYHPGIDKVDGNLANCFEDGTMTNLVSGNNVDVSYTGTLTCVYKSAEVPQP